MKTEQIIISESGEKLIDPKEGFILYGSIFVSQLDENGLPNGGLLGDGKTTEKIIDAGIKPTAYSVKDFIKSLGIDPFELKRIAEEMIPRERVR